MSGSLSLPVVGASLHHREQKKADVAKHPKVLNHVGLLVNGPPGEAGLPFI
jgi:hypothetical protein